MGKHEDFKNFFTGLFLLVGIGLTIGVILTIGFDKGLTEPKFQITVLFRNVGGMIEGAPIRLSGVTVGNVQKINFLEKEIMGRGLEVKLNIYNRYRKQLEKSSRFSIKTEGILGAKFIEIKVASRKPPVDLNQPILGEDPFDVEDSAEIFLMTAQSLNDTAQDVRKLLKEVQYMSHKTKRLIDRVEQRVIDGSLFKVF